MNLYDQLRALQVLEHAFEEWSEYRKQLTDYILNHTVCNKSLAIWGAGRCNDLDLRRLSTYFSSITLIDRDENAMQEAIERYGLEETHQNIHKRVIDFVGLTDEDYRQYAQYLIDQILRKNAFIHEEHFVDKVLIGLDQLYEKIIYHRIPIERDCFDYTIVIGVHSQLLSMLEWIWSIILQNIQHEEYEVRRALILMNDGLIEKFNHMVLKTTRKTVFMGCELCRVDREGPIQGAYQAMKDIEKRVLRKEIEVSASLLIEWPFHLKEGVAYQVNLQKIVPF